jgi:predicted aldo/keto reductase-like oxidoreductase
MFETQLERLGVEYFDFYLLHAITFERYERQKAFGAFDFMKRVKESGRAKRIGFSFHSTPEMLEAVIREHPEFEFVQLQINYQDWRSQKASELYQIARDHGLPVIVMEPVKGGSLANLPAQAAALRPDLGVTSGQADFALRFAASLDGVKVVLSGMSTLEQVEGNVRTFSNFSEFTEEERVLADRVMEEINKIARVPCTACAYCVEGCPARIDIPKIFSIYNEFRRSGNEFHAQFSYSCIEDGHRADSCISCGACASACPQGIDVPGELAALHTSLPLIALVPQGKGE